MGYCARSKRPRINDAVQFLCMKAWKNHSRKPASNLVIHLAVEWASLALHSRATPQAATVLDLNVKLQPENPAMVSVSHHPIVSEGLTASLTILDRKSTSVMKFAYVTQRTLVGLIAHTQLLPLSLDHRLSDPCNFAFGFTTSLLWRALWSTGQDGMMKKLPYPTGMSAQQVVKTSATEVVAARVTSCLL